MTLERVIALLRAGMCAPQGPRGECTFCDEAIAYVRALALRLAKAETLLADAAYRDPGCHREQDAWLAERDALLHHGEVHHEPKREERDRIPHVHDVIEVPAAGQSLGGAWIRGLVVGVTWVDGESTSALSVLCDGNKEPIRIPIRDTACWRWPEQPRIIGAKRPARGLAPFAIAPAVARDAAGLFVVSQLAGTMGERLTDQEWRELIAAGEAFELPESVALDDGRAQIWIFRGLERWRALGGRTSVRAFELPGEDVAIAVMHDPELGCEIRSSWAESLHERAFRADPDAALWLASAAHLMAPMWRWQYVALVCALLGRAGDERSVRETLALAERACGSVFALEAERQIGEMTARLDASGAQP